MSIIVNLLYLLAIVLISPKIIYRMIRQKRYRSGWSERLGDIDRRHPEKKCIWIHAVSVGEVNATKTLISALSEKLSDHEIVISSTTDTGLARAKTLYEKNYAVFYFPFDLSWIMKKAFSRINPSMCLLMELEVWPNLASIARKNNVPVVVVNGRLSDKSFPRYKLIKPLTKWMFAKVTLFLAQTEEYARRFKELGCAPERVVVTNSLKYDTAQITDTVEGTEALAEQLNIKTERIFVAGGTGPGEEKIILQTFAKIKKEKQFQDLRLIIVPRKPERFDEVAALITQFGLASVRYSKIKSEQTKLQTTPPVILGDTMGDLKKFYSLATIVFVGRSLTPMGGSDMMEPTALGKCTLFGPHTFNFKQTVDALLSNEGAILINDGDQLTAALVKCLTEKDYTDKIAANGRNVIKNNQGATQKTIEAIAQLLK